MDSDTVNALINAGSGLVGAIVGAGGSGLLQRGQRRDARVDEVERERRAEERRVDAESLARVRKAAEDCDALFVRLTEMAQASEKSDHDQVRTLTSSIFAQSVFLPEELRHRVDDAARVVADAEYVALDVQSGLDFHYRSTRSIVTTTYSDVHEAIAAHMQGRPLPAPSLYMRQNIAARKDYIDYIEESWADRDDDYYDASRRSFFKRHPDLET